VPVDRVLGDTVLPDQYDCLLLPGGAIGADALRSEPRVRKFVFGMDEDEKPIAAIGHAAWILISAGVVSGRRITGCPRVRDDILNAGAYWADQPVAIDGNLITSRGTRDLAEFDVAVIEHFSTRPGMISTETRRLLSRSRIA
jgi:protease I